MRRPYLLDFVLGNRLVRFGFLGFGLCDLCLFADSHDGRWLVLSLVGVMVSRYAGAARSRLIAYRNWKGEWDQMTDAGTSRGGPARRPPKRWRGRLAFAAWLVLALWLRAHPHQAGNPAYEVLALGFAALTLWGVFASFLRLVGRLRRGAKPKAETKASDHIVCVVPSVPRSSPSLAQIRSALPAYCKRLMTGSSASS